MYKWKKRDLKSGEYVGINKKSLVISGYVGEVIWMKEDIYV